MTIKSGIVLYGSGNTGKTSTLLKLITLLKKNSNFTLIHPSCPIVFNTDIQCCFIYTPRNKKIAICSGGDTKQQIIDNLAYCANVQAEVFIMPARSYDKRNGSRRTLIDYAKKKRIDLIWLWKSFVDINNKQNRYNIIEDVLISDLQNNEVDFLNNYLTKLL